MSKYAENRTWYDDVFPKKVALEMRKRQWKSLQKQPPKCMGYIWALRRAGRFDEMQSKIDADKKVAQHWADIESGAFAKTVAQWNLDNFTGTSSNPEWQHVLACP